MSTERGFVLVNALLLVAALAAVALLLLGQASAGRDRLEARRDAAQLTLNLDAFEAYAITVLNGQNGAADHLRSPWARAARDLPLARGQVSGQIIDQQGLFNVNWLTDAGNLHAQLALDRLVGALGVPASDAALLRALLQPGGPARDPGFARLDPPEAPVGGALVSVRQLDRMPGLSTRARRRLLPLLTALPGDSPLNPNTARPEILRAVLPDLTPAQVDAIVRQRDSDPFTSVQAFLVHVGLAAVDEDAANPEQRDPEQLDETRLTVHSDWFGAQISATLSALSAQSARRELLLHRTGLPAQTRVTWRETFRP